MQIREFPKSHQLAHNWRQEDWLHHQDDSIFDRPVYGSAASENILILLELFNSKRLLLGFTYCWGVIAGVVVRQERAAYLRQIFLRDHSECEVAVPASSKS